MIAKLGETTKMPLREQTVDGVMFNVYLKADAVNTTLDPLVDFLQKEVSLKCTLFRNKKLHEVVADNLEILGIYSALNYGMNNWYKGNVITYKDVAVKEELLVTLYMPFGGVINIKEDDIMTIEVLCGRAVFSANIDQGVSYVEFSPNPAIGYETGTPQIRSQVVTAGVTQDKYSIGDNVTKLAFIQLDKDNISSNVITALSLASTQLNGQWNFFDLLNRHWNILTSPVVQYRYGNTQPVTAGNEAKPYLPKYPQSVVLFAGSKDTRSYIDNVNISAQFNSANITAGKNYFVSTTINVTKEQIVMAESRMNKHIAEKEQTIPDKP